MRYLIVLLVLSFLAFPLHAQEKKVETPLFVGVVLSKNPQVCYVVYKLLKEKGISCKSVQTEENGTVMIVGASSTEPKITVAEIQAEVDKIKAEQDIEKMITAEMRVLAIQSLKDKGKLDKNYVDKSK